MFKGLSMKTLPNAFLALNRRNSVLAITGLIHLIFGLLVLFLLPFETRQVMGINLWIKPIKFYLSSAIYLWTLAIYLSYLKDTHPRSTRIVAWSLAMTILIENVFITMQAARGTMSHYNISSPFDGMVFSLMGIAIAMNTLVMAYLTVLFLLSSPPLPKPYLWGIRLGLLLFLFGSAVGGMMIGMQSHNVGVPMGGEGLPFTNWSTRGGDLRIAHFLGLHALQIIPLVGYLLARYDRSLPSLRGVAGTVGFAVLYAVLTWVLYWQAMNGHSLVAVSH
jgi:hypothetical protein